jgi:hypothetical protein
LALGYARLADVHHICVVLAVLLAACSTSTPDPSSTPDPQPAAPATSPDAPLDASPTVAPEPESQGIHGTVIRRSDVGGTPDEPVEAGTVVVIPQEQVEEFWRGAGFGADGPPQPSRTEFDVDPGAVPAGVEVGPIGADGRFATGVAPGQVLLCLADDLPDDDPGPPHRVNGCATVTAPADGVVTLTTGFGGVMAVPGDDA